MTPLSLIFPNFLRTFSKWNFVQKHISSVHTGAALGWAWPLGGQVTIALSGHFIAQYFNIVNFVHKDNLNCQWAWWLAPWYSAMMTMSELERLHNKDIIYPLLHCCPRVYAPQCPEPSEWVTSRVSQFGHWYLGGATADTTIDLLQSSSLSSIAV